MKQRMRQMNSEQGTIYVEYFVLALIALLAAIAFFDSGNFGGTRANLESAFDTMANHIAGQ